jgi:hypothetical protein
MTDFFQETDTRMIYSQSTFPFPIAVAHETIGSRVANSFPLQTQQSSVTKSALNTIRGAHDQAVAAEARKLLSAIAEMVESFRLLGFDLSSLPPLHAFILDDGSISIEWIQANFRIGFNIEVDQAESGWYLLSNDKLGQITASGRTSTIQIQSLVLWLLNFVIANS